MNDYRIDKLKYVSTELKDYTIPVGMNTIMWLGGYKPTNKEVQIATNCIRKPEDIFVLSYYSKDKRDYIVYQLVLPLDYNPNIKVQ